MQSTYERTRKAAETAVAVAAIELIQDENQMAAARALLTARQRAAGRSGDSISQRYVRLPEDIRTL